MSQFFSFKFLKVLFDQNKTVEEYTKTKFQTKYLQSIFTGTGDVPDITFNNLEIGKFYRYTLHLMENTSSNAMDGTVRNGTTILASVAHGTDTNENRNNISIFQATATTLLVNLTVNGNQIYGNGTRNGTFFQLEELPNHEETTQWT